MADSSCQEYSVPYDALMKFPKIFGGYDEISVIMFNTPDSVSIYGNKGKYSGRDVRTVLNYLKENLPPAALNSDGTLYELPINCSSLPMPQEERAARYFIHLLSDYTSEQAREHLRERFGDKNLPSPRFDHDVIRDATREARTFLEG